jgi:hypothetical protein
MRRRPEKSPRAVTSKSAAARLAVVPGREFLTRMERGVLHEIRKWLRAPENSHSSIDLTFLADLSHVVAHWHDDRRYLDAAGQPKDIPLLGDEPSLNALISRVFPRYPSDPVVDALLRTGLVHRSGPRYRCVSRQLIHSMPIAAYLSGLIPILGLVRTLKSNIAGERKLLQQTVLNSNIPVEHLPSLLRAIDERIRAVLQEIDALMIRYETYAKPDDPRVRIGFAAQLFEFPYDAWVKAGAPEPTPPAPRKMTTPS